MIVDLVRCIDVCQYWTMRKVLSASPCCPPVLHGRLSQPAAEELAASFRALADPARLRLLSFIAAQPAGEACVCHLTAPLEISQPTVSHHLKVLVEAGLLTREKRGTWAWYAVVADRLREVAELFA